MQPFGWIVFYFDDYDDYDACLLKKFIRQSDNGIYLAALRFVR